MRAGWYQFDWVQHRDNRAARCRELSAGAAGAGALAPAGGVRGAFPSPKRAAKLTPDCCPATLQLINLA